MTPYYQHNGITIYHADCRDVLPELPSVDLVLTDPPYGINAARDRKSQKNGWIDYPCGGWDKSRPPRDAFESFLSRARRSIVWGGNYFTDYLPPSSRWLIWDKGQEDFSLADVEMAWCSWPGATRRMVYSRSLALRDGKQHATQKPLAIMKWCIVQAEMPAAILDPFCGSGTMLRAAMDMSIPAIGIEIEERYCEIAAKRLAQGVLDFDPPVNGHNRQVQASLLRECDP